MKSFDVDSSSHVRKRRVFSSVFASSRAVSRDILHTTRSLYRRDHVSELVATIEPPVAPAKPPATQKEDRPIQAKNEYDGDLVLQLNHFVPGATAPITEHEEYSTVHRTPPLALEDGGGSDDHQPDIRTLFPRPPSFKRSKEEYSPSNPKRSFDAPRMDKHSPEHRPPIPPRKDSLPHQRMLLSLVDHSTKLRDSTQSVTAYVSAEYEGTGSMSPLTLTSWLSDPDGPPDDMASWNRSVTAQQPKWTTGSAATRPQMHSRSKTTPVYSTTDIGTPELPDAAYERVLREKLRHHAGQVKKRLDTSPYYSSTVKRTEIEVHLAFVQAAEEVLKQSPIWRPDNGNRIKRLLEG